MCNYVDLNITDMESIYKAMLCVLKSYDIEFDDKHQDLWHQIIDTQRDPNELLPLLEPFYETIKANTQYPDDEKEDEDDDD